MVPHSILGKATDEIILLVTFAVDPIGHCLHHLTLNLRVGIVEIRMEQATGNIFSNLMNVHGWIIPGLDYQIDSMGHNGFR